MNGFSGLSQEVSQMLRQSLPWSTDMKSLQKRHDLAYSGVHPIGQQTVAQFAAPTFGDGKLETDIFASNLMTQLSNSLLDD